MLIERLFKIFFILGTISTLGAIFIPEDFSSSTGQDGSIDAFCRYKPDDRLSISRVVQVSRWAPYFLGSQVTVMHVGRHFVFHHFAWITDKARDHLGHACFRSYTDIFFYDSVGPDICYMYVGRHIVKQLFGWIMSKTWEQLGLQYFGWITRHEVRISMRGSGLMLGAYFHVMSNFCCSVSSTFYLKLKDAWPPWMAINLLAGLWSNCFHDMSDLPIPIMTDPVILLLRSLGSFAVFLNLYGLLIRDLNAAF